MVDCPEAMRKEQRGRDGTFQPDEYLYRRVPLTLWEDKGDPLEPDAIDLPDMSTVRSKYAHPEWARFDEQGNFAFSDWGVVGFMVGDIPASLIHLGHFLWTFEARHVPLKMVYPHSEVWAFENDVHINAKAKLDPQLHLRWRELLLRKLTKCLGPRETVLVRQTAP